MSRVHNVSRDNIVHHYKRKQKYKKNKQKVHFNKKKEQGSRLS